MSIAFESWGANAPAYPELIVSFPDGRSLACQFGSGSVRPAPSRSESRPAVPSLRKSIELGERLVALLEERGDFDLKRRGPKPNSLRALSIHLRGVIPLSSMWRAIAIFQLAQMHPELGRYRHLGVAHLSVLLGLKGPLRLGLLRKAEIECWSRRRLQLAAREINQYPNRDWFGTFGLRPYLKDQQTL